MPKCPKTTAAPSLSPVARCRRRPPRTIQVPSMYAPLPASRSQVTRAARPSPPLGAGAAPLGCESRAHATTTALIVTVMSSPARPVTRFLATRLDPRQATGATDAADGSVSAQVRRSQTPLPPDYAPPPPHPPPPPTTP